jgi:diguanylate cyclase (GGDEF)-like protein/PAS domain S-box-containing protein
MSVLGSCGLSEDNPALTEGRPICPAGIQGRSGRGTWARLEDDSPNRPSCLSGFGVRSGAWVPLGKDSPDPLLVLYRSSGDSFDEKDVALLGSVAHRLFFSVEARARGAALERLALAGHRLSRILDSGELLREVVILLGELSGARTNAVLAVRGNILEVCGHPGLSPEELGTWPCPVPQLQGWDVLSGGKHWWGAETVGTTARTVLYVPVTSEGRMTHLLRVTGNRPGTGHITAEVLDTFAVTVGAVLENISLYRALRESEASSRPITDSINDLISVVDAEGRFVYASPSYERGLGHDPSTLLGSDLVELVHPQDRVRLLSALNRTLGCDRASPGVECRTRAADDSWVWGGTFLRMASEQESAAVLSTRVIEERKRLEDELVRCATHDPLTGLANRSLITAKAEAALALRTASKLGLLFCDLDKFKAVNDRLGHEAGDELLRQAAVRLKNCLRPSDTLARFGGDEFVVLLEGVHSPQEVDEVGCRLLRSLDEPFDLQRELIQISMSIGGVLASAGDRRSRAPGDMLRDADAAMYAAKARARGKDGGRIEIFDEDDSLRSLDRWSLEADIRKALERHELLLRYQPIVDLASSHVTAFEALLRRQHPVKGLLPPTKSIPIAEETGAVVGIGRWVIQEARTQLSRWRRLPGAHDLSMPVDLSSLQLDDSLLAATTRSTLVDAGLPASSLWLEVVERGELPTGIHESVVALSSERARFTPDDFGISNSNLAYLKRFPLDGLKIDKSFVSGITEEAVDSVIIRAILAIAEWMGLSVVAEGVETSIQRDTLRRLGCTFGRGHLFSRPVPSEDVPSLLVQGISV